MKTKRKLSIIAFILILIPVHFVYAASSLDQTVQTQLGNENISVSIRALESGKLLYEKNGEVAMKPASTLKLLTAAAALDILGPDFRFQTNAYINGEIKDKVLYGDVYIKGGGDPTFQKKDFKMIASVIKHQGIDEINGNLYGDDTLFLGEQLLPGISIEDESFYFATRNSALTMSPDNDYDAGSMILNVTATSIGKPPFVLADPNTSGMIIHNQAVTVNKNQKNTIDILRKYGTNRIDITGNIPIDTTLKDWVSLNDPTINTLHAVKKELEDFGITFNEQSKIDRKPVPIQAKNIYLKHSIPLKSLLVPFLKLSNNSIANILVNTIGKQARGKGSLVDGIDAIKEYGAIKGLNMYHWKLEDGSGLSHTNQVTSNELSLLLTKMYEDPNFDIFYSSLPIGGQSDRLIGGSLRKRFIDVAFQNRVIAKTGHISGVYTLAGYVKTNSGKTYSFAIMTQNQTSIKLSSIDEVVKKIVTLY